MHMPPPSAEQTARAIELGHEPSTVSVRGLFWFKVSCPASTLFKVALPDPRPLLRVSVFPLLTPRAPPLGVKIRPEEKLPVTENVPPLSVTLLPRFPRRSSAETSKVPLETFQAPL